MDGQSLRYNKQIRKQRTVFFLCIQILVFPAFVGLPILHHYILLPILFVVIFIAMNASNYIWLKRAYPEVPLTFIQKLLFLYLNTIIVFGFICCFPAVFLLTLFWLFHSIFNWQIEFTYFIELIYGLFILSLFISFYAVIIRPRRINISQVNLQQSSLASNTAIKILHLSDLHVGNIMSFDYLSRVVDKANAQQADIIMLTGDMLTNGDAFIDPLLDLLAALKAKAGVFCVLGNHDYYCSDVNQLVSRIKGIGVEVLRNSNTRISVNNTEIIISGIEGIVDNRKKQRQALIATQSKQTLGRGQLNILLAHDPLVFESGLTSAYDLVLSGHTHGGQIGLPFKYRDQNLAKLKYCYHSGLYRKKMTYLHVSAGVGCDSIPLRFGVPPEMTVITVTNNIS